MKDIIADDWNTTLETDGYKITTKNKDNKIVSIKKGPFKTEYNIDMEYQVKKEKNSKNMNSNSLNSGMKLTPKRKSRWMNSLRK